MRDRNSILRTFIYVYDQLKKVGYDSLSFGRLDAYVYVLDIFPQGMGIVLGQG
jgi:hypothetical protein